MEAAAEVVAAQFAGGKSVAQLAGEWERDAEWVEDAIRGAMLAAIPRRDGGMKASRAEERAERSGERHAIRGRQTRLEW